jgi:hypothetical protein
MDTEEKLGTHPKSVVDQFEWRGLQPLPQSRIRITVKAFEDFSTTCWMLRKNENQFEDLMVKLAHMDGEFVVEKMNTAKRYDLLNGPLDGRIASWKVPTESKGKKLVTIADFFFVDGKFRWDSTTQYFPFQKPKIASIVPAKLVKKVQPEYPAEARERELKGL